MPHSHFFCLRGRVAALCALALAATIALPAAAEDDLETIELADEETSRAPPRARVLEEIIVTAQKREQSLADVPVSVTAVDGRKLDEAGIENLTDLSEYAPNFKLVDSGLIPNIYMRGVGSGSNQGFELSVGIFADGIHLGRPHQTRAAFMDLERIEVLKGPQSILFGKNAIAGAVNITSARSGPEFAGEVSTSISLPTQNEEVFAVVSTPLSEDWGVRLAARHRSEDGDLYNLLQQRMEPGLSEQAMRLTLDWRPASGLDASLKLEKTHREQAGRRFQITDPGSLTRCTGEDVRLDLNRVSDARELATIDAYNSTLTVKAPFATGEVTSVTGVTGFDASDLFDADSSSIDTLALLGTEDFSQFSQELRFSSDLGGFMEYIGGAFYQRNRFDFYEFGPTKARTGALADSPSCDVNLQVLAQADLERDFRIVSEAWSLFFQTTLNFRSDLRSTLGLRYVFEDKSGYRRFLIFEPGTRNRANPVTMAALDRLLINEHELSRSRDAGILLPSVNLQFDVTDDIMTYASFSRGAKSGSYDARNNNGNTDPQGGDTRFEFDDEVADAWELGGKLRLAQGAASMNIALFLVDYTDMQVSVYDGVAGFTVTNAGNARTQGLEIDTRWLVGDAWMFSGALGFLDFTWTDYKDGPCYFEAPNEDPDAGTCDLTGRPNLQTPRWTASLSANYTLTLGQGWQLDFTLDGAYSDDHFTSGDLDPRGIQSANTKFNGRIALGPPDQRWSVALVGKNLTDELTYGIGAPTSLDIGGFRVTTEPTRVIGLNAPFEFKSIATKKGPDQTGPRLPQYS